MHVAHTQIQTIYWLWAILENCVCHFNWWSNINYLVLPSIEYPIAQPCKEADVWLCILACFYSIHLLFIGRLVWMCEILGALSVLWYLDLFGPDASFPKTASILWLVEIVVSITLFRLFLMFRVSLVLFLVHSPYPRMFVHCVEMINGNDTFVVCALLNRRSSFRLFILMIRFSFHLSK